MRKFPLHLLAATLATGFVIALAAFPARARATAAPSNVVVAADDPAPVDTERCELSSSIGGGPIDGDGGAE